jgi:hypothetical protein
MTPKRILLGILGGALSVGAIWLALDWINEQQTSARANAHIREIVSILNLSTVTDFHDRLDKVRTFINDNSVYKVDKTFRENQGNQAAFAAAMLAYATGSSSEPAHMECSSRTNIMGKILRMLGYETRVVAIFNTKRNLSSHSFLEVMNPVTGRWESQDAQFDIYWRSRVSGERTSLAEAAEDLDAIEPCGRNNCGWNITNREGHELESFRRYLDIISLTRKERDLRYALYTSRADLTRIFDKEGKRGTFCEVEAKRCKQGFYDLSKYSTYEPGLTR